MLMMVDPHVHFHVFPRYEGSCDAAGVTLADQSWPGPPDLPKGRKLEQGELEALASWLKGHWPACRASARITHIRHPVGRQRPRDRQVFGVLDPGPLTPHSRHGVHRAILGDIFHT